MQLLRCDTTARNQSDDVIQTGSDSDLDNDGLAFVSVSSELPTKSLSNGPYEEEGDDREETNLLITGYDETTSRFPIRPKSLQRPVSNERRLSDMRIPGVIPGPSPSPSPPPLPPYPPVTEKKAGPISWKELPNKGQLTILVMARLSEPLTQTSLAAYMFYQLKSFDPLLPDSTIAAQAGVLQGSFTGAQFFTAVLWGRIADSDWGGRKMVLLVGLFGTCLSAIGFGFSRSFLSAAIFRVLGGILNGNVGVIRTMVSEIVKEKKYQARAFLLLPMCFNIGVIVGPILGGLLADPVVSYPKLFGEHSVFGGVEGVWWMEHWPYALPNLLSAMFLACSAMAVFLGLKETLSTRQDRPDLGSRVAKAISRFVQRLSGRRSHGYSSLAAEDQFVDTRISGPDTYDLEDRTLEMSPATPLSAIHPSQPRQKLPFRRIWTRNVLLTFLSHAILAMHIGTFNNLWFIFLSTPRFDPRHPDPPSHTKQTLPFGFTGGLGMPPRSVGFALAVLGAIGITLQLAVYPSVNHRFGTLKSLHWSLLCFPVAYCIAPYLAIVPSSTSPPDQASGFPVWAALAGVLFIQVVGRTFALPANTILVNNCSPQPSVLGTVHGMAQSASSASRTIGPIAAGWLYGVGLNQGVVGGIWWALAAVACLGLIASRFVQDGDGHEILLEGEKVEQA